MSPRPRLILDAAAVLTLTGLLGLAFLAPRPTADNAATTWFPQRSPRIQDYAGFSAEFGADEVVLIEASGGDLAGLLRLAESIEAVLDEMPEVEQVLGPGRAYPDAIEILADPELGGSDALQNVGWTFQGPLNKTLGLVDVARPRCRVVGLLRPGPSRVRAVLAERIAGLKARAQAEGRTLRVAGQPLVNLELDRAGREVAQRALPLLVGACLALLLVMTRSLRRTLLLLLPVGLCVLASEGILGLSGVTTNLIVTVVSPLVFVLLLATGCHVVVACDDLRRRGVDRREAAWGAARGKAVPSLVALGTTAIGFGSLAFSHLTPIRTFGWLTAAGLALGAPTLLVVLPALLARLDPGAASEPRPASVLAKAVAAVTRLGWRGWPVVLVVGGTLTALGILGGLRLRAQPHAIRYLAEAHPLRQDHEALEAGGAPLAQLEAVVSSAAPLTSDVALLERLDGWAREATALPGVRGCVSVPLLLREAGFRTARVDRFPARFLVPDVLRRRAADMAPYMVADGRRLRFSFTIDTLGPEALDALRDQLRERFAVHTAGDPRLDLRLTGSYELLLQIQRSLLATLVWSLLVTAGLMQLVLVVSLRSLRLGLAAALPNALPVATVLGLMAALDISLDVGTCMTAAIALGIAVDDTLHFLFMYRSYGLLPTARATGRAIVLSSLVIAAGFLAITTSSFVPTRNFGLLCAAAMGGALVGDLLLLPACLRLLRCRPRDDLDPLEPETMRAAEAAPTRRPAVSGRHAA